FPLRSSHFVSLQTSNLLSSRNQQTKKRSSTSLSAQASFLLCSRFFCCSLQQAPANSCKKLTKRRLFARRPSGRLAQSTLDGGTRLAGPFYNTVRAACRGPRRRVKPFCN